MTAKGDDLDMIYRRQTPTWMREMKSAMARIRLNGSAEVEPGHEG